MADLQAYFAQRGVPFEPGLVRRKRGGVCHVFYEPTLPGFRALPDSAPIRKLFGSVDPDGFLAGRKPVGDSLDVIKRVLRALPRPIDVTLSLTRELGVESWDRAIAAHFPQTEHSIRLRASAAAETHPWAQDYVKSGEVAGKAVVLTPRRLYEGRTLEGERFRPLVDALHEEGFVASKLSWEGGDLQVAADPRDPDRRILFFGAAVRRYWGDSLSAEEFGYVLRVELGADEAVDLSDVGFHADFVASFLSDGKTALVAQPILGSRALARDAAAELALRFKGRAPAELVALVETLGRAEDWRRQDAERIRGLVGKLDRALRLVPPQVSAEVGQSLEAHVARRCPGRPADCFSGEAKARLYREDPKLLQMGLNVLADAEMDSKLASAMLGLIEGQLPDAPDHWGPKLDAKAERLAALGFRVIRTPYLPPGGPERAWAGVSYVNALAFDNLVFLPRLGLGKSEDALFQALQSELGDAYEVVPVQARFGLLHNGGIHCVFGIERAESIPASTRISNLSY
ncbi:MAG: agmatine deiminase family protein [Bryobacterales bacterium]|nr:agmatine deiminase family protein [Bryobacterales bacterium]